MREQAQTAARSLAAGRMVVGVSLCVAPSVAAPWAGDCARGSGARMIIRGLGVRDAALGVGTLASADEPVHLRRWLVLAAACDAVDLAVTLTGPRSRARSIVLAMAAGATVAGAVAAASV